jgi:hypothetical protein
MGTKVELGRKCPNQLKASDNLFEPKHQHLSSKPASEGKPRTTTQSHSVITALAKNLLDAKASP